ncbi:MAG: hypothetical protein ABH851_06405 [Methanobacteriota archaeon]
MGDDFIPPPEAVEVVSEKVRKKRILPILLVVVVVLLVAFIFFLRSSVEPISNVTVFSTSSLGEKMFASSPLIVPPGFTLTDVNHRSAPFRMGKNFLPVDAIELTYAKDGEKIIVFIAKGTVDGWKRIIGGKGFWLEESFGDNVYSADYKYFDETINFIYWWHNDSIIGVNASVRTVNVIDLTEKLVLHHPPTESLA